MKITSLPFLEHTLEVPLPKEVIIHDDTTNALYYTNEFNGISPSWRMCMIGILGNGKHKVKPWYLPFDWCFARVLNDELRQKTIIVNNSIAPNIAGLQVLILDKKVIHVIREIKPVAL